MRTVPMALLLLAAGCGAPEEDEPTQDVKVDHNDKAAPVESVAPRTCFADGHLYAVWQDDRTGVDGVWFNASADGGATWMPTDIALNGGEAAARTPDIACVGERVYVVWEDERDGDLRYTNIYADVSEDAGRSWLDDDMALDADPEGAATSLAPRIVAVDDAAYVAWFDNRDGAYDIYVQATADDGATWLAAPTRVDTDAAGEAYSALPRLVADGDGRVVVAWEDSRDGASDIYANVSDDAGVTFGAADQRLDAGDDPGATNSFLPSLAMAGDAVYAVWHDERNGENRDVLLAASADGGTTWSPVRVDSDAAGAADSINAQVAAVDDRVHVVWQDDRAGGYDIYQRFSRTGGADWAGDEVRMDTDAGGESQSYDPVLQVRGDTVLVGWQDRRGDADDVGFDDLYYNYSEDGGLNWSQDDLRINSNEPGTSYAVDLSLALGDGGVIAVWADGRFGSSDVFCADRALGEESHYVAPVEEDE
jgi:hypothetical protein